MEEVHLALEQVMLQVIDTNLLYLFKEIPLKL